MGIQLRHATVADALTISLIHAASWRDAYVGLVQEEYLSSLLDDHWVKPFEHMLREGILSAQLACNENGTPVGCVSYGAYTLEDNDPPEPEGWGYVLTLYVHPAHARQGYGTALLRAAEDGLRQQGYLHCYLYVLTGNESAIRFYTRNGYSRDGKTIAFTLGSSPATGLRMVKSF